MNSIEEVNKEINDLVSNGTLPLGFYSSKIKEHPQKRSEGVKPMRILFPKYKQNAIPNAESSMIISKIYHVL